MAALQQPRKLVHKQFNSPMGLYSAQNVKETLDRELKAFGQDGIEVDETLLKPSNLANSAVLRALEEEENEQQGGYKRVAWPPVAEGRTVREFTPQLVTQPPYPHQQHQQQQQQQQQAHQPPLQQSNYQRPGASPVPAANQQPEPQQYQQHQQLQQQQYRGESPGIITLRKEAPITQQPAPVYTSQPAAASYRGGSSMRGDLKWPPPEYKEQAVVENEERRRIAQGPICRPRRINKDYTQFFAKNALSHHYPSYKTPPGTQHIYSSY